MKNHTWQKLFSNASSQYTGPTVICKVTVSPSSPPFLFPHWWQRPAACAQHSVQLSWLLYSTNALGTLVLTSVQSISPANSTNTHSHTVANVNQLCCFSAMLIITNTEHLGSMGEIYANQIKSWESCRAVAFILSRIRLCTESTQVGIAKRPHLRTFYVENYKLGCGLNMLQIRKFWPKMSSEKENKNNKQTNNKWNAHVKPRRQKANQPGFTRDCQPHHIPGFISYTEYVSGVVCQKHFDIFYFGVPLPQ